MSRRPAQSETRLTLGRKLLWSSAVTLGFFLGIEALLALVGVEPYSYRHDPYVGFASSRPLFDRQTEADGTTWLETAESKTDWFNRQRFPADKPEDTYRIFCLGGSTTYGRPYDDETSFCGWLRAFLPAFDGSRRWEVVNAGGISYASYRVARLMEELAQYEPDLFLVYSGHNEFLERRTYGEIIDTPRAVSGLVALASRTRLFTTLRAALDSTRGAAPDAVALGEEVETVLDSWLGPESYERDDEQRRRVLDHYEFNLHRMTEISGSAGALTILVTPASNLRDCEPFRGLPSDSLSPADAGRTRQLLSQADHALQAGDPATAADLLRQAIAIDGRQAALHYRLGRALYELGRFEDAGAALRRAREEDVCPLRALGPMVTTVRRVAAATDVSLVDYEALMARRSARGIPGSELFLDHVHPTIEGNRLLALAILETLSANGVAEPEDGWGSDRVAAITATVEAGLDRVAHAAALRNLAKVLNWAGKTEEPRRLALQALETTPDDVEALFIVAETAQRQGRSDEAVDYYGRTLAANPEYGKAHQNLGNLLFERGDLTGAERHYRETIRLRPGIPDGFVNLGAVLADLGRLAAAADSYRSALAIDPGLIAPRYELAWLLAVQGDPAAGMATLDPVLEDGSPANRHYVLGLALFKRGQLEPAHDQFSQAVSLAPGTADLHDSLGVVSARLGRRAEAIGHFREALRIAPAHPTAASNLRALEGPTPADR
jgi:tetratricopeptide (TPR) repeat protein